MAIRTINLTAGDDQFTDNNVAHRINGLGGNDTIHGRGGDDVIYGGPGFNRLFGELGNDILLAQAGSGILDGGPGNDWLDAGPVDLAGQSRPVELYGRAGADVMFVRSYGDVARGGQGDDTITVEGTAGAAGDEFLFNGLIHAGKDTLLTHFATGPGMRYVEGGGGADLFSIDYQADGGTAADGIASIMIGDFTPSLDKLAVFSSGAGGTVPINGTITFARFDTNQDGKLDASDPASIFGNVTFDPGQPELEDGLLPNLVVQFATGDSIQVLNAHELHATDFNF